MAFRTNDFLKETSTTTGTGNITLGGARTPGSTFASAISNGDTFHYAISHDTLNEWETGLGTMLTSTTFSRSVISSSNANALVNFSGGSKRVDVVLPASRIVSLAGPLFVNAVSVSSGPVTFSNGNGVTFGVAGNVITASVNAGLTTNNAFQSISLGQFPGGVSNTIENATSSTISGTILHLPLLPTSISTNLGSNNVGFFASSNSLIPAAWMDWRASGGAFLAQLVTFAFANAITFGIASTTNPGDTGVMVRITAIAPRLRQVQLFAPSAAQSLSITQATDSTVSNSSAFTFCFPALDTASSLIYSSNNVFFRLSTGTGNNSLLAVAHQNYIAGTLAAGAAHVSFINTNGVTFGGATTTAANFGRIFQVTASVDPQIGLISHVGGNSVSNVRTLVFSDASNVTFSLSTAANAATVFASVAAGGGGGITAFALSNAASSVMATGLTYNNANGFSFLLSTGAGNAATLSGSYTVPAVVNSGLFQLTNSVSSVNASQVLLSAANGFSFLLSTAASGATLSGSYTVPTVVNSGLLNVTDSVSSVNASRLIFSNLNGVTFGIATGASIATLTASVAAAGGGLTYSGLIPFNEGVIVATTMPNNNFLVSPLGAMPAWQFDRVVLGASFSNASNSTNSNTLRVGYGLYSRNGSSLSLIHSDTTSFAYTGSGTVGNYSLFSNFRMFTFARTSTMAASNYWVAMGWSLSTAGNAGCTAAMGMISQNFSVNIGFMNVAANLTNQIEIGRGIVSSTTFQPPNAIPIANITGSGVVGWRAPYVRYASGSF